MDIYHTIIRPLVTEKAAHMMRQTTGEHGGTYCFEVHADATKSQVRNAVEQIYGVKVVDVRTSNRPARVRRFRFRMGESTRPKKAMVVLDTNSHIDLF